MPKRGNLRSAFRWLARLSLVLGWWDEDAGVHSQVRLPCVTDGGAKLAAVPSPIEVATGALPAFGTAPAAASAQAPQPAKAATSSGPAVLGRKDPLKTKTSLYLVIDS